MRYGIDMQTMLVCPTLIRPMAILAATMLLAVTADGVTAELGDASRSALREKLERVHGDIGMARKREAELLANIEKLKNDRRALDKRLIKTARAVQDGEARLSSGEKRLGELNEQVGHIRASLAGRQDVLGHILGAMQTMTREPPPAIAVHPEDALKAVRGAMLLGTILPEMKLEAETLAHELSDLVKLTHRIDVENTTIRREHAALMDRRIELETLVTAKRSSLGLARKELDRVQARARTLITEVTSLKEFIARMEDELKLAAARAAEKGREQEEKLAALSRQLTEPGPTPREPVAPAERKRLALAVPGRLRAALSVASARGSLPFPARGETVKAFGAPDGFGGAAKGVSIATRAGAQITSPSDGVIVYAGPFRSYGMLLIINAGQGYHVLLAGMKRIDVEIGQSVLAGEPVGLMEASQDADESDRDGIERRPVLYVEFRKDGAPIDPQPWWVQSAEKVRG